MVTTSTEEIGKCCQVVSWCQHEVASAELACFGRGRVTVVEQVARDIGEDNAAARAEPVQRPERDQAVTGSDVQQRVVGLQRRPVQHLVTDLVQRLDQLLAVAGIATMPDVKEPTMPAIPVFCHRNQSSCRSGDPTTASTGASALLTWPIAVARDIAPASRKVQR